jgi:hypothetical protein
MSRPTSTCAHSIYQITTIREARVESRPDPWTPGYSRRQNAGAIPTSPSTRTRHIPHASAFPPSDETRARFTLCRFTLCRRLVGRGASAASEPFFLACSSSGRPATFQIDTVQILQTRFHTFVRNSSLKNTFKEFCVSL